MFSICVVFRADLSLLFAKRQCGSGFRGDDVFFFREKITRKVVQKGRTFKGFHFLMQEDQSIFQTLLAGEFNIGGFRSGTLLKKLPGKSKGQISRILQRLRVHRLIKKVGKTYKYYLTSFGREVIAMALKFKEMVVIPQLAAGC